MKRSAFLTLAGILPVFFGMTMLLNPKQMLDMVAVDTNLSTRLVLQWMSCPLISIGIMNLLARNDEGSKALRAIMIGNILTHVLGMGVDIYEFVNGYLKISGIIFGSVLHLVLAGAFMIYLKKLPKMSN